MLTAQMKTGEKICLGLNFKKETLLLLRKKEEFFCPICGEGVSLKLGEQRIFHFAHKQGGSCRDFYENETSYHMGGKRQLYQWLLRQKIPSVLEYYDKEIQQRPDIFFTHKGKKYALEFQCSNIPETVFIKRTQAYIDSGYIPLWIVASKQLHHKKKNIFSFSNFLFLFLRESIPGTLYIPSYCPDNQQFEFIENITPITIKNSFVQHSLYSLQNIRIDELLEKPKPPNELPLAYWNSELERFKLNTVLRSGSLRNPFLQELYNRGLNLFLLPPEIGLPVPYSLLILTSPVIWQSYFYLDVIAGKNVNDIITSQEIWRFYQKRIYHKEILIRHLPLLTNLQPVNAIFNYLKILERLGILDEKRDNSFQLKKNILIPKSNRELEEMKQAFFRNYQVYFGQNDK